MITAKKFLLEHRQSAANIDVKKSLNAFWEQMSLGLSGKGGMPMIPTYLTNVDRSCIQSGAKRLLIDAGGTNFRSAIGYFDEQGNAHIERISKTHMPATDRFLTKDEFYAQIAQNISPLLSEADTIGFCFSYPVEMDKDIDGTVLPFTKEVKASEAVGTKVGAETVAACKALDGKDRRIVILNDTAATLLGGMATSNESFSAYLGYIYGTGTNVCYAEDTANISKVTGLPRGKMLVNTECGTFDGFPLGDFDRAAIARTADPNRQLFEKMTSGKYLAEVIYEAFCAAQAENLFVGETHIQPFNLRDVSEFLAGNGLHGMFRNETDELFAKQICRGAVRRAAKMGAIVNSALAIASVKDKSLPVAIVAEGTTFDKLPGYRTQFRRYLTKILGAYSLKYKILQGKDLNLVGTLMATMAPNGGRS